MYYICIAPHISAVVVMTVWQFDLQLSMQPEAVVVVIVW